MTLLDLRGLRCPWPAIRVARALREGAAPLVVVADDPAAPGEIAAVAAAAGYATAPADTALGAGMSIISDAISCAPVRPKSDAR